MNSIIKPLPQSIQPLRLAERGATLSGTLPLSAFPRLQDSFTQAEGEITIELQLGKDDENIPYLKGILKGHLPLICQRCSQPLEFLLELQVSLSPVLTEAAAEKLPDRYEPLLLQEDQVLLSEVIEEELLLSLPTAPKHEQLDCNGIK